jgi:hypothetical protein
MMENNTMDYQKYCEQCENIRKKHTNEKCSNCGLQPDYVIKNNIEKVINGERIRYICKGSLNTWCSNWIKRR